MHVAFPFGQIKIQEPGQDIALLASLAEGLAVLVASSMPGSHAEELQRRAHELASRLH